MNKLKNKLFFLITFVLLFLSFTVNILGIADNWYNQFDRADEGYVVGRIMSSEVNGLFSLGGLPCNYVFYKYLPDENGNPVTTELWEAADGNIENMKQFSSQRIQAQMYDDYINNRKLTDGHSDVYKTQPSMMANVYSALNLILPFSNEYKLLFFRLINLALTTLAFILIICWVRRNFGLAIGVFTFILLLLSSWPMRFSHNLWWALWSFYIPFITMLLVLEKKQSNPEKFSGSKVLIYLFVAMFVKFLFTGAEFITSTAVMAICPILYYSLIEKRNKKETLLLFIKSSAVAIAAIFLGFLFLIIQIKLYEGSWQAGVDHIIFSFTKRAVGSDWMDGHSTWSILKIYLTESSIFLWKFAPSVQISFGMVIAIIGAFCVVVFLLNKSLESTEKIRNNALILITIISIAGPLSWLIIFVQHAYIHPAFDYITWYMPFCIYGFVIIGLGCQEIYKQIKSRI